MKKFVKSVALTFALALSAGFPSGCSPKAPASQPLCNPMCVTTRCAQDSDCTAPTGGKCNFACPGVGCCVYS